MVIYIKPVEYCNLKCRHCYNTSKHGVINYQALNGFLKNINNGACNHYFVLHGGEPLLAPLGETLALIRSFPENKWRITTNLCVDLTAERLAILRLMHEVRTSFDIGIRFGTMQNLMLWRRNIKKLRAMEIPIYINVCLSTMLLRKDPVKLLRLLDHQGIATLALERIAAAGSAADHDDLIPSYDAVDEWLCRLYQASKGFPQIRIRTFEDIRFGIHGDSANCRAAACCQETMTINADGTIGVCPNNAQRHTIGSLSADVKELLRSKQQAACTIKQECWACSLFDQCFGGCPQLEWQGSVCPYPHKLGAMIREEL